MGAQGGYARKVVTGDEPSWSSDGRSIAFTRESQPSGHLRGEASQRWSEEPDAQRLRRVHPGLGSGQALNKGQGGVGTTSHVPSASLVQLRMHARRFRPAYACFDSCRGASLLASLRLTSTIAGVDPGRVQAHVARELADDGVGLGAMRERLERSPAGHASGWWRRSTRGRATRCSSSRPGPETRLHGRCAPGRRRQVDLERLLVGDGRGRSPARGASSGSGTSSTA